MNSEKEILAYLQDKQVYIYGAGNVAQNLTKRLNRAQIPIQGYLVSDISNNPLEINNVKVFSAREFTEGNHVLRDLTIVIAVAKGHLDILSYLLELGFYNIIILKPDVWQEMKRNIASDECNEKQTDYLYTLDYPARESEHCAVVEKNTGRILFRTSLGRVYKDVGTTVKQCRLSPFEALYGTYCKVPSAQKSGISNELAMAKGFEVYAAVSHLDKQKGIEITEEGVIPLQVGAALTSIRRGCLTDNVGDNISCENRNYCECTGLYWIWKNTTGQKYVGLSHYRRRFRWDESGINYIEANDIDAVVTIPVFAPCGVKEFFAGYIGKCDWELLRRTVTKYDNTYAKLFQQHEQSYFYISCNLAVFKREWFDRYCEFAFTVAEEIDREYKSRNIMRQDRYMGYLFENLLSLFLIRHHDSMKIAYADMEFIQ